MAKGDSSYNQALSLWAIWSHEYYMYDCILRTHHESTYLKHL